jgi:hypothetical protein
LEALIINHDLRKRMGDAGLNAVESWYSLQIQAPRLKMALKNAVERMGK